MINNFLYNISNQTSKVFTLFALFGGYRYTIDVGTAFIRVAYRSNQLGDNYHQVSNARLWYAVISYTQYVDANVCAQVIADWCTA